MLYEFFKRGANGKWEQTPYERTDAQDTMDALKKAKKFAVRCGCGIRCRVANPSPNDKYYYYKYKIPGDRNDK